MNKVYLIWIGWIWVSALARFYKQNWWDVFWSDKTNSELLESLQNEWIDIIIWEDEKRIEEFFMKNWEIWNYNSLVIYTEAIPKNQVELQKAKELWVQIMTYAEWLAEIANRQNLIAITWTHGKSTTTSLTSLVFKNSSLNFTSIVWTLLKEFWQKNFFSRNFNKPIIRYPEFISGSFIQSNEKKQETKSIYQTLSSGQTSPELQITQNYFVIEACEYKRSFLRYKPYIWIITNIDLDHLDYYKDLEDYISAFKSFIDNINVDWYAIINWECENSIKLIWIRDDINYIVVKNNSFSIINNKINYYDSESSSEWQEKKSYSKSWNLLDWQLNTFPEIKMQIPWEHILFDAKLAYIVWNLLWIENDSIIKSLENYSWVWRRSEIIWKTINWNILMSDYWHHPTEIFLTTKAIKEKYIDKKIVCIFQPHQYSRTIELIKDFINCFSFTDILIIPDIYESRDTQEDKNKMNSKILVDLINHSNKIDWMWLKNTLNWILKYDIDNPNSSIIILQWAWNIDDLRYKIKTYN